MLHSKEKKKRFICLLWSAEVEPTMCHESTDKFPPHLHTTYLSLAIHCTWCINTWLVATCPPTYLPPPIYPLSASVVLFSGAAVNVTKVNRRQWILLFWICCSFSFSLCSSIFHLLPIWLANFFHYYLAICLGMMAVQWWDVKIQEEAYE